MTHETFTTLNLLTSKCFFLLFFCLFFHFVTYFVVVGRTSSVLSPLYIFHFLFSVVAVPSRFSFFAVLNNSRFSTYEGSLLPFFSSSGSRPAPALTTIPFHMHG